MNGLNARDCVVLTRLLNGDFSPTKLRSSLINAVHMTAISDKLEKKKLITVNRSKEDRRSKILSITEHGREAIS